MEIIIEKGVPLPSNDETVTAAIASLQVGDSFPFPSKERSWMAAIVSSSFHAKSSKRFKISIKGQPANTARLWRVEDSEPKK